MKATYCFIANPKINCRAGVWRYTSLVKASRERDALIAAGGRPGDLWSEHKDPKRPLRAAWYQEGKTVRQVLARLNRVLKREGLIDESIGCPLAWDDRSAMDKLWYGLQGQTAVFASCRSNEAHYLRVAMLQGDGRYTELFSAKLWRGLDNAMAVANRVTQLLGA